MEYELHINCKRYLPSRVLTPFKLNPVSLASSTVRFSNGRILEARTDNNASYKIVTLVYFKLKQYNLRNKASQCQIQLRLNSLNP